MEFNNFPNLRHNNNGGSMDQAEHFKFPLKCFSNKNVKSATFPGKSIINTGIYALFGEKQKSKACTTCHHKFIAENFLHLEKQ